jgi:hypothetical protein
VYAPDARGALASALIACRNDAMSRVWILLACAFTSLLPSCASRAGWGKGGYRELFADNDVEIRRGVVRVDVASGELLLPWIGARVPSSVAGEVRSCRLVVFRDDDHDRRASASEIVGERSSQQAGVKVLFSDIRARAPGPGETLYVRIEVTTDRRVKAAQFELQVDP